ncbi:hypothetical protein [Modestobacter sp. VKM Ac-2978]|uniref:hypothetical protein n=1 Tax=Modestobacter sp. VKM Ac-2978 TaxID=3004132 RepID=UPI0022AB336B|nr:hypothetical protein [Modestobacter sp. VKM Ac-2978]MCZ2849431.1 hypothetical protein [Modestobacter sp. VKM Ac-2978]
MYLLVTIVGVCLGYGYAELVTRRSGLTDRRRWLLLAPVWAVYLVVLLAADTRDLAPQAVQAFALATVLSTLVDVAGALWRRRRATHAPRSRAEGSS